MEQKSLLFKFSSVAPQRTAYSKVSSQMEAHLRTAVHCRLRRLLDSNPGLQFYNLVSLPMSHHCSLKIILEGKATSGLHRWYLNYQFWWEPGQWPETRKCPLPSYTSFYCSPSGDFLRRRPVGFPSQIILDTLEQPISVSTLPHPHSVPTVLYRVKKPVMQSIFLLTPSHSS